jgi:UPF0755 protein
MRTIIRWILVLLFPCLVAAGVFRVMTLLFLTPIDRADSTPVFIEVSPGRSFRSIARDLQDKNVVRYWWSLEVLGRIKRGGAVINSGEYELSKQLNPVEVLQKLMSGETFKRRLTVKEGVSMWAIGPLLEDTGLVSKADFDQALIDQQKLQQLGIQANSFEGYLFPETYFFSKPITSAQIIERMTKEFDKNWTERFAQKAQQMQLTRHEVVTLASIIEKETGIATEQPIISSVIHNRLKVGMKLQMDPTVIYGIPNFNGNLTKDDLERPSPYNTYLNYGLPPGPIGNPGKGAIEAALFPATTKFIYFVADGSGGHFFSATLAEHNEAVKRFQLRQ